MKKNIRRILDYIPLVILVVLAIILISTVYEEDILLGWKHWVGFVFLIITLAAFFYFHPLGVLLSGLTLILGLVGLLSFDPVLTITSFGLGPSESGITIFRGQPVYFIWLFIHFLVSGRFYVGIITKQYWTTFLKKV
ncbi:MAG: hypothetical protein SFU21_09975 [Flavihumibacter sp.]|nr:hypothetical protein [Flavihumibacter sp.]